MDDLFVPALADDTPLERGPETREAIEGIDPGTELEKHEKIRPDEVLAMQELADALSWHGWKNKHGWHNVAMYQGRCYGVVVGTLDEDAGRVVELNLENNRLRGKLPPCIGRFPRLRKLMLHGNALRAEIAPELGELGQLEWLSLSGNELSGLLPPELGRLRQLQSLAVQDNQLSGPVSSLFPLLGCGRQFFSLRASGNRFMRDGSAHEAKANFDRIDSIRACADGATLSLQFNLKDWALDYVRALAPTTLHMGDMLRVRLAEMRELDGTLTVVDLPRGGGKRHVFDFQFELPFEATMEDYEDEHRHVRGWIHFVEVSSIQQGRYQYELHWNPMPSTYKQVDQLKPWLLDPLREGGVQQYVTARIEQFILEYEEKD